MDQKMKQKIVEGAQEHCRPQSNTYPGLTSDQQAVLDEALDILSPPECRKGAGWGEGDTGA